MNVFSIKFGLDASSEQAMIIDKLKNAGFDVIQISSGLLAKSDKTLKVLNDELSSLSQKLAISELDLNTAALDPELSKDGKLFAGIED